MTKNTKADVNRLPKWAQEHVRDLEMERDAAVRAMRTMEGQQAKSPVFFEVQECTGEEVGPSVVRCYIQSRSVTFKLPAGMVYARLDYAGNLSISADGEMVFAPLAANTIYVVPRKESRSASYQSHIQTTRDVGPICPLCGDQTSSCGHP